MHVQVHVDYIVVHKKKKQEICNYTLMSYCWSLKFGFILVTCAAMVSGIVKLLL